MRLIIKDPDGIVDYRFCIWLTTQMRHKYYAIVNINKYSRIDEYLSQLTFMENHKGVLSHSIVQQGLSNLIVRRNVDSYSIHINESIIFDATLGIKLSSMCKLINYGTLSIKGYPVITELFTYYATNMDNLLKYYYTYVSR